MQEEHSGHLKIIVQRVENYNKYYTILNCAMLCNCKLKTLHKLLHLCKYSSDLFFHIRATSQFEDSWKTL